MRKLALRWNAAVIPECRMNHLHSTSFAPFGIFIMSLSTLTVRPRLFHFRFAKTSVVLFILCRSEVPLFFRATMWWCLSVTMLPDATGGNRTARSPVGCKLHAFVLLLTWTGILICCIFWFWFLYLGSPVHPHAPPPPHTHPLEATTWQIWQVTMLMLATRFN